jgi:hypothetical protein
VAASVGRFEGELEVLMCGPEFSPEVMRSWLLVKHHTLIRPRGDYLLAHQALQQEGQSRGKVGSLVADQVLFEEECSPQVGAFARNG